MAESEQVRDPLRESWTAPWEDGEDRAVTAEEFQASFGEDIRQTLNVDTWRVGTDLSQEYSRIEAEVREAVHRESSLQKRIRAEVFPRLRDRQGAPINAGTHEADRTLIEKIHREFLFQGGIEASDGALQVHDTLPLTIYQMGVTLVSYQGNQGTWCQRLFRKDLQQTYADPVEEALASLERRALRSGLGRGGRGDTGGELVQKALLDYAERAILLRCSQACWRMGHGNPVTYELLTGGHNLELMVAGTNVIRELVEGPGKFVFVAQEPGEQVLLTIAQALRPMEFAIVSTLDERLEHWLHQRRFKLATKLRWNGELISPMEWIPRFIEQVASRIVVGLFRATAVAPAQVFYAHVDHADYAAHMVLADSVLQEHRGSPLLVDIARHVCDGVFADSLESLAESAYAAAGAPWRYVNHRSTRTR